MRFINYLKNLIIILMAGTLLGCFILGYIPQAAIEENIAIRIYEMVLFGIIAGFGIYWMVKDLRRD